MKKFDYDLIAIGSGSASGAAAFVAKKAKHKIAIVEEFPEKLGGNCPNYACVPTKALLKAAETYRTVKSAGRFGVYADSPRFDFKKIVEYRDSIVNTLTGTRIERNLKNAGIDLIYGRAKFVSDHEIELAAPSSDGARKYSAANILIGTGSREFVPPIEGLSEAGFITSDQASRLGELPKSLIIIGAGPVGTEFAQAFSSFGVKITLLQRDSQILQREDPEVAVLVQENLAGLGVEIVLNVEVLSVRKQGSSKIVKIKSGGQEREVEAGEVMIAAGRRAALDLNLEAAGVAVTPSGKLELNEYLQTSQPHIWAAGDAAGNWQFTHTAAYEGDLVGRNICHRHEEKVDYRIVPRVTFCEPEVASVGITEKEAQTKGLKVRMEKFPTGGMGRSLIERDHSRGFIKIIADSQSLEVLGAHIVGLSAGQLVHELAVAMRAKLPITEVAKMIHAYPSFSESIAAAAERFF